MKTTIVILLGAAVAVAGAAAGLLPVATETASGCGSAFFPAAMYFDSGIPGQTCPEAVAARGLLVWPALAAGALLALGARSSAPRPAAGGAVPRPEPRSPGRDGHGRRPAATGFGPTGARRRP